MFHRTILFALKPGLALDRVRIARESLQRLIESMPGVDHLAVVHNVASDHQGYNLAMFSGFETKTAAEIFFRHPEYQRVWQQELGPLVERHLTADGESDG